MEDLFFNREYINVIHDQDFGSVEAKFDNNELAFEIVYSNMGNDFFIEDFKSFKKGLGSIALKEFEKWANEHEYGYKRITGTLVESIGYSSPQELEKFWKQKHNYKVIPTEGTGPAYAIIEKNLV